MKEGRDLLEGDAEPSIDAENMATEETTETDQEEEEELKPKKPFNDIDFSSLEQLPDELAPIHTLIELV